MFRFMSDHKHDKMVFNLMRLTLQSDPDDCQKIEKQTVLVLFLPEVGCSVNSDLSIRNQRWQKYGPAVLLLTLRASPRNSLQRAIIFS